MDSTPRPKTVANLDRMVTSAHPNLPPLGKPHEENPAPYCPPVDWSLPNLISYKTGQPLLRDQVPALYNKAVSWASNHKGNPNQVFGTPSIDLPTLVQSVDVNGQIRGSVAQIIKHRNRLHGIEAIQEANHILLNAIRAGLIDHPNSRPQPLGHRCEPSYASACYGYGGHEFNNAHEIVTWTLFIP
jgi:hypothetical protein